MMSSNFKMSNKSYLKQSLQLFDGLLMPREFFTIENFRQTISYKPSEDEFIIDCYPKSGTTWIQYIVWEILNEASPPPYVNQIMWTLCPQLEFRGTKILDDLVKRPRCLKTHMPFNYVPFSANGRYIYCVRNPYDLCVSYYNFIKQAPGFGFENGSFDDFFENFINDHMSFGGYFDHINSWYSQKHNKNILFLTYEEIKLDLKTAVLKISQFMGDCYLQKITANDNLMLKQILNYMDFSYMKNLKFIVPKTGDVVQKTDTLDAGKDDNVVKNGMYAYLDFFKVGKSGYGQELLSADQKFRLSQKIKENFNNDNCSELLRIWQRCGIKLFY